MLFGFDLQQLLLLPVKDAQARKAFVIGALLMGIGFIIPIIPHVIVYGYVMQIMRQIYAGQQPHMVEWSDWNKLFKDGLKLYGVVIIYSIPLLLGMFLIFSLMFASVFIGSDSSDSPIAPVLFLGAMIGMLLWMPVAILSNVALMAGGSQAVYENNFSAGFKIGEWWAIFRKNWSGFVLAYLIQYGATIAFTFVYQTLIMTIILICVAPFFMLAYSMVHFLIMYTTSAQAYKIGRERLESEKMTAPAV